MSGGRILAFERPRRLEDYPTGTVLKGHTLVEGFATWRSQKPVLTGSCVGCGRCALLCPDAAVSVEGKALSIDLDFCKGCGICARECPKASISMAEEPR